MMKTKSVLKLLAITLLIAVIIIGGVNAAIVTVPSATVKELDTTDITITLDSAPNGLSGTAFRIQVLNGTVGEIYSVSLPAWAGLSLVESTPSQLVNVTEVDTGSSVQAGATNIVLAIVTVKGFVYGSSQLGVNITSMDDDVGGVLNPSVTNGTLTVSSSDMWNLCGLMTTNAATAISSKNATLNGDLSGGGYAWFVWGGASNAYTMRTENKSVTGSYSQELDGIPLMSGKTYYYRSCSACGYGQEQSFTMGIVTPVPTTTYTDQYYKPFVATKWNMAALAEVVPTAYTDKWGYIIWALLWGVLFLSFWIRQEDVTVPAFLYIIIFIGLNLANWMPTQLVEVSWLLLVAAFGGIIYTWFRSRKNG